MVDKPEDMTHGRQVSGNPMLAAKLSPSE